MLTADAAVTRAKGWGIPIFTTAQGEALLHPRLVERLTGLSEATGGARFLIRKAEDISAAFEKMSGDLMHGYLVAFQPPPATDIDWHKVVVTIAGRRGLVIRAREGYYSE